MGLPNNGNGCKGSIELKGTMMSKKPTMRIIRNLARSGGTLLGKCIGCMDQVNLFSEIHPANLRVTNPMMQAHKWFKLINLKDVARWKIRPPSTLQFVMMCDLRAKDRGDTLVLRDWSHLDYVGVPFAQPKYGYALADELKSAYEIKTVTTVRHPIDQFISLTELSVVQPKLNFELYLKGCAEFAQYAHENGFYKYEDFTKDPDSILSSICNDLDLKFDSEYKNKWYTYTTITGDTRPGLGRGSTRKTIEHFGRKEIDESLLKAFRENTDYQRACELLGYEL